MFEAPPPDKRPLRPKKILLVQWGLFMAMGILLLGALTPQIFPWLLETVVAPRVAASLGLSALRLQVRQADFGGVDLEEVTLEPGVHVATVGVRWSISGLLRGRLQAVRITGAHLVLQQTGAGWEVPGLLLPKATHASAPLAVPEVEAIHVEGVVEIRSEHTVTRVPVRARGHVDAHGTVSLTALMEPAGQTLHLTVHRDESGARVRLTAALHQASLAALMGNIPAMKRIPISGAAHAELYAAIAPQKAPLIQATASITAVQGAVAGVHFAQEGSTSVDFRWQDEIYLRTTPLSLREPLPVVLTLDHLRFSPHSREFTCTWRMDVDPGARLPRTTPLRFTGQTTGTRTPHGWEIDANATLAPTTMGTKNTTLTVEESHMRLGARLTPQGADLRATVQLGPARLTQANATIELSGLTISATATSQPAQALEGEVHITGERLLARAAGAQLQSTHLAVNATFSLAKTPHVHALLSLGGTGRYKDATGVASLTLPVSWPTVATTPGSVHAELHWKNHTAAGLNASISQETRGFRLVGALTLPFVGIQASLRGLLDTMALEQSWMEIQADQKVTLPAKLSTVLPKLASLSGSARLRASASLDVTSGRPKIPVRIAISQCMLRHEKAKLVLENGSLHVAFEDLAAMRSVPGQRLSFERLQLGSVVLDAGEIHFQVEGAQGLLVERCDLRWAQGRVGTQAFRITPGMEDVTVGIYCDRVHLAQALEQLGMPQIRGDGTASGRIPMRWRHGTLTFDNGFLYSTPGESGVLRVNAPGVLTVGIPTDTPQLGQMDLAAEALKNFIYQWAKVTLNTEGQELMISLQLDGKPATALPFVYDQEIGGFIRISGNSPGSNFQGIRLDVHFRLPIDQLLHSTQLIKLMRSGG